jgi:two-component system, OmpR family, KDP operon response regulator KdpE
MNNGKVLIVDDEDSIRKFLRVTLASQGYDVVEASSGQQALSLAASQKPDLVILDLGLPDIDGVEVTHLLREWTQVPVIILSVKGSESDKIAALDAGADDYLTKPFGVGELLARLRAALRRKMQIAGEPVFTSGILKVDLARRVVTVADREVQLTPNEYSLLRLLVTHAGKVLTHRYLLREVWGAEYGEELHMLHVNISNLRRKIEPDSARPYFIVTERGVGYRLRINDSN